MITKRPTIQNLISNNSGWLLSLHTIVLSERRKKNTRSSILLRLNEKNKTLTRHLE